MIETTWERATPEQYPIVYYLCYDSSLAILSGKEKLTGERRYYYMRLPYTLEALKRRAEYGRDASILRELLDK